ncbi:AEC family transporter [Selenomonas caprae]|uniref:AEC family transporter n=1 Tax=Selenomonas caprae TaxID=2606905 RepID=A0A5D6WQX0_9FIRM|nr:AEC family transporter [Selenomonas caprae]TYZ29585.1 AEC family transporter [Selenomonas caprae]
MDSSLANAMGQLLFLLLSGYILKRKAILSSQGIKEISSLAVNITCPLLVIASVSQMQTTDMAMILSYIGFGAGIYILLPVLAWFFTKRLGVCSREAGTYQFMLIFSNTSLLGFPIVQAMFGMEAVFYTAVLHIPFDLLVYSYGMYLMNQQTVYKRFCWQRLWNPGLVLTVFALLLYVLQWHLPQVLADACYLLGNITTPLSMLIIGASLQQIHIRELFRERRLYWVAFLRLLVIPAGVYLLMVCFTDFDYVLVGIAVITFGMPVGSMIVMLANAFEANIKLSVESVSLTTAISFVTIPFLKWWLL